MYEPNNMICPRCHTVFGPGSDIALFSSHVKQCSKNSKKQQQMATMYEKFPVNVQMSSFVWKKNPKKQIDPSIYNKDINQIKECDFQEKQAWFRRKLQSTRIPWTAGSDKIILDKSNILMGTLNQIKNVNMLKEVKIQFIGEKVNDAGGLLREWVHMVIKQIFDYCTGIFILADTEQITYRLKWDEDMFQEFSGPLLQLLGIVIGKSLFERIPLTCFLDRTILKQLCGGEVQLEDISGFDKQLHKNWKFTLECENVEDLGMYFVTYHNNGETVQEIQLMEGDKQVKVTNENKFLYIDLCIQMQTVIKVKNSIKKIKTGIQNVFPIQYLSIFKFYELQMLLYGVTFIDIHDWFENTIYKEPYNRTHKVIKWFWNVMESFDQDQLSKVLHFCTGSTRTPIHGFGKLQSNRGNYSKFLIVAVQYTKKNPFPKAHTCFNRLQLPLYPNEETLKMYLSAVAKNELDGMFGLD